MKKINLLIVFCSVFGVSIQAQNLVLFDGETSYSQNCGYENGSIDSTNTHYGNWCFSGLPNQYAAPTLNFNCQNQFRADISHYDQLWFYTKTNIPGSCYRIWITQWPNTGNMLDITPYIEGNTLTTEYNLVKIPIDSLKNENVDLAGIEFIYFDTCTIAGRKIWIDDMVAMDITPGQIDSINIISEQVLKLTFSKRYDTTYVQNNQHYFITSSDDADFFAPQYSSKVGMHFYVSAFSKTGPYPTIKNEIFLSFETKFKNGMHYQITITNIKDLSNNDFFQPKIIPFVYNDNIVTHTVKVNQVGYLPESPKYAYIGNWLGGSGMLDCNPGNYYIKDASSNQTLYTGVPNFKGFDQRLSGEKVYECDFTDFQTTGKYYLYVPGFGRSYNFNIATNVYDTVCTSIAREFYYQRCGTEIKTPYADLRWTHPICHTFDAFTDTTLIKSALYNGEAIDSVINMPHGWHDAGDFGKYTMSSAVYLYYFFQAFEYFPTKFGDNTLNIPETGNGIPDILDEAKWNLDWLKEMQADDGGVYDRCATTYYQNNLAQNDYEKRFIFEKTTYSTAYFCAIMARAYKDMYPFFPEYADSLLVKSEKAWQFLVNHPNPLPLPGSDPLGRLTVDPEGDIAHRAWACAELYRATGNTYYDQQFHYFWSQNPVLFGTNPTFNNQNRASMTYSTITEFPTDSVVKLKFLAAWKLYCDNLLIPYSDQNFYRISLRTEIYWAIGWGAFAQSPWYSLDLLIGYYFLNNQNYLNYAKINLNMQLGANPQDICYITGVGSNSPKDPLHMQSIYDNVIAPVPGIAVYGPAAHMSMANPYDYQSQAKQNVYPMAEQETDPYPIYRRYWDVWQNVMQSEFSIGSQCVFYAVYSFFNTIDAHLVTPLATMHGSYSRTIPTVIDKGKSFTFTFIPDEGYHVSDVLVDSVSIGISSAYTFSNLTKNHTIQAIYSLNVYSISAEIYPINSGTITGSGTYNHGQTVSLNAAAEKGYTFANWTENGIVISTSAILPTFTATANRILVAVFQLNTGISDFNRVNSIIVNPNPNTGRFEIDFENNYIGELFIKIYSDNGSIIKDFKINKATDKISYPIDLDNVAVGTYNIVITTSKEKVTKKIIIR